jgi:hypothetical protein
MNLSLVSTSFAVRLDEVREAINALAQEEALQTPGHPPFYSPEYRRLAGCCFVLLYGALEYGISNATRVALQALAGSGVNLCDLSYPLYCIVLDSHFESAATVKSEKKWNARLHLLSRQEEQQLVTVRDTVFDTMLQMTNTDVMKQIFEAFGISDSVVPDPILKNYVEEIKNKRNAVAHGRESATAIGSGITSKDLALRCEAVNRVVNHYIAVFDSWFKSKSYIRAGARHLYP